MDKDVKLQAGGTGTVMYDKGVELEEKRARRVVDMYAS